MMSTVLKPGTIVEVLEPGQPKGQFAVVIRPTADQADAFAHLDDRVWVRYDNGSEVPVRGYWIHTFTTEQVLLKLNGN